MDDRELIATIREALAQATPGPWHVAQDEDEETGEPLERWRVRCVGPAMVAGDMGVEKDARLIAGSPAWLSALCDALERHLETSDTAKAQATEVQS